MVSVDTVQDMVLIVAPCYYYQWMDVQHKATTNHLHRYQNRF